MHINNFYLHCNVSFYAKTYLSLLFHFDLISILSGNKIATPASIYFCSFFFNLFLSESLDFMYVFVCNIGLIWGWWSVSFYFFYLKHLQINTIQVSESESHSVVSDSLRPHGLESPRNSPGQNTGVVSSSLLQGIFPTRGLNPGLLHCGQILYQLSHKGSPRILE